MTYPIQSLWFLVLLLCSFFIVQSVGVTAAEITALQEFYSSTNGEGWADKKNWNNGNSPCLSNNNWWGVACVLDSVAQINLPNNNLSGTLPEGLIGCHALGDLFLKGNEISGTLPPKYNAMTNLRQINLDNNRISGTLPSQWSSLPWYRMSLKSNLLSGTLPPHWTGFGKDPNGYIYLDGNRISGTLPPTWGTMGEIFSLDLSDNKLEGSLPSSWATWTVRRFDLSNNSLTDYLPTVAAKPWPSFALQNNEWYCDLPSWCSDPSCSPCIPPSPSASNTPSRSPTPTPTPSRSFSSTRTTTPTGTSSGTTTPTVTSTPTSSPTDNKSRTPTISFTSTKSVSRTSSPSRSSSPSRTPSKSNSRSVGSSASSSPESPTSTPSKIPSPSRSHSPKPSAVPVPVWRSQTGPSQMVTRATFSVSSAPVLMTVVLPTFDQSASPTNPLILDGVIVDITTKDPFPVGVIVSYPDILPPRGTSFLTKVVDLTLMDGATLERARLCFQVGSTTRNQNDVCLGYFDTQQNEWVCEDNCLEEENGNLCGTTDHFTSFAILFNGMASSSDPCASPIFGFITGSFEGDLGLVFGIIAAVIVISLLVVFLGTRRSFAILLYGKEGARITHLRTRSRKITNSSLLYEQNDPLSLM